MLRILFNSKFSLESSYTDFVQRLSEDFLAGLIDLIESRNLFAWNILWLSKRNFCSFWVKYFLQLKLFDRLNLLYDLSFKLLNDSFLIHLFWIILCCCANNLKIIFLDSFLWLFYLQKLLLVAVLSAFALLNCSLRILLVSKRKLAMICINFSQI